jgi:integrase
MQILESLAEVDGHLYTKEPKNGKARTLELPGFLVEMLRAQMGLYPSTEGYVFSAAEGGPLRHHNFYRRHFKPALLRAGLNPTLRFHDLRHSCASILIGRCPEEWWEFWKEPRGVGLILIHPGRFPRWLRRAYSG